MKQFTVDYKETPFLKTSQTAAYPNRLNWRCELILTRNADSIKGKKILDLASHDGRFSYACLKLGARHVTGIEFREHLVESSKKNLVDMGFRQDQFDFHQGDIFEFLPKVKKGEFDTILCLGFFYHTIRQIELLREFHRLAPQCIILDTNVKKELMEKDATWTEIIKRALRLIPKIRPKHFLKVKATIKNTSRALQVNKSIKPCLAFKSENHVKESATIDKLDIIAWPTKSFIEFIFRHHGYRINEIFWSEDEISDWIHIYDYRNRKRASYIAFLNNKN